MKFTHIDINFGVTYEGHQNWSKILFMDILRVFDDHHMWFNLHGTWEFLIGNLGHFWLEFFLSNVNSCSLVWWINNKRQVTLLFNRSVMNQPRTIIWICMTAKTTQSLLFIWGGSPPSNPCCFLYQEMCRFRTQFLHLLALSHHFWPPNLFRTLSNWAWNNNKLTILKFDVNLSEKCELQKDFKMCSWIV